MIAVTGATGHTGKRLVAHLVKQGRQVRIVLRDPSRMPLSLRQSCEVVRADLTRPEMADRAFTGCEAVFALTHIKFAPHVVRSMKAAEVRRGIFMSSTRRFTQYPEETARQVIEGEQAVRDSGLTWTIIRASMIYGGADDNNIAHLVNFIKRFPVHPLIGGGKMKWQPVFVKDLVQALVAALENPHSIEREYTVAGPEPVSYREMVEIIARELPRRIIPVPIPIVAAKVLARTLEKVSSRPRLRVDQVLRLQEDKVFDITDARRDLEFAPRSFEEGIHEKLRGRV